MDFAGREPGWRSPMKRSSKKSRSYPMSDDDLFTAPEVARFCRVDLKTIHNWVDRQQIEHFRTPGRHLRFRRADVIDFLRRYNYPVPEELQPRRPVIYTLAADAALPTAVRRSMGGDMDVQSFTTEVDLGLAVGRNPPDVVLIDADSRGVDHFAIVQSLRSYGGTEPLRLILCSEHEPPPGDPARHGVDSWISKSSLKELRSTIEALLRS
jgi:excisionase family DNA binding protein